MSDVVPKLGSVVINVNDMERETTFWRELLGVDVAREIPGFFVWLAPQRPGGISVALQLVPDAKEGRNRLHLDTAVDDLDAAQARVEALGGSLVETHEIMGFTWRVMADPEGNEFCIAMAAD
jgi:predicted enzyme related to lactoylglutathione lyase